MSSRTGATLRQLTFDVGHVFAGLRARGVTAPIGATVKIAGSVVVDRDLAAGETLVVTISDADGEVVGHAQTVASAPSFAVIEDKGHVFGFERQHKLKVDA